jgi:hypothetical protein
VAYEIDLHRHSEAEIQLNNFCALIVLSTKYLVFGGEFCIISIPIIDVSSQGIKDNFQRRTQRGEGG